MYYPKSKILESQFTAGKEFVFKDTGKYYNGYYCKLSDGTFFTGKTINDQSKELIKYNTLNQNQKRTINVSLSDNTLISTYSKVIKNNIKKISNQTSLKHYTLQPSQDDYNNGFVVRYFAKKLNVKDIDILEINKDDYNSILNKDEKYYNIYQVISLEWKISGPDYDNYSSLSSPIYGIIDTNRRVLEKKEYEMVGIRKYLNNLKEFSKS